ncbi:MAG: DUF86 domain-containing protein [Candidatus Fermentibacter sp.]|nr:DUF86 domain-containing protein [Candidatus Fermentibacter sp.]
MFIRHALDCIERILIYTSSGRDEFMSSMLIQDAVIRNLQVMCESVSRVPEDIRSGHPEIEWRGITGLRNILVHDYLGVDVELVWQVVEAGLPALKNSLEALSASL